LSDAFARTSDTDAHNLAFDWLAVIGKPFAVTPIPDHELPIFLFQFDGCPVCAGVPKYVGQGFSHDPKNCCLYVRAKARKFVRPSFKLASDTTPLCQPFYTPIQRGGQARFIQQRRMQEVRKAAHPGQRGTGKLNCLVILRFIDEHFKGKELLAQIIMKLSCYSAALQIVSVQLERRVF
jgi:hypothetical protein